MKLATKLVEAEAIIIKKSSYYCYLYIIKFSNYICWIGQIFYLNLQIFDLKIVSEPTTIKTAKKENIIKFKIKLKLPFFKFSPHFLHVVKNLQN